MLDVLKKIDQDFFLYLNSIHHPVGDSVVYWFTSTVFWIPLYIFLAILISRELGSKTITVVIATIILCDQVSSSIIKPLTQRFRPCCDPTIQYPIHLVGTYIGNYSFPSSHATNTFGIAMLFWLFLRKRHPWISILFMWALFTSYGRIYGGVHYPGDIIIGLLLGLTIGWLNYSIHSYIKKKLNKNQNG